MIQKGVTQGVNTHTRGVTLLKNCNLFMHIKKTKLSSFSKLYKIKYKFDTISLYMNIY